MQVLALKHLSNKQHHEESSVSRTEPGGDTHTPQSHKPAGWASACLHLPGPLPDTAEKGWGVPAGMAQAVLGSL